MNMAIRKQQVMIILKICVRKGKQRKNNLINKEHPVKI